MDPRLLPLLRCPRSKAPLRLLSADELAKLNAVIANGSLTSSDGKVVPTVVECALLAVGQSWLYPVYFGKPVLTADAAIVFDPTDHE